jgi:general secretion pathway protein B
MSSILEALKKLEDEKSSRQSGAGNIAGKVVKDGRRPKPRPVWLLPASMAAVATTAALATYIIMSSLSPSKKPGHLITPVQPLQPQQAAPQAAAPIRPTALPSANAPNKVVRSSPSPPVTSQEPVINAPPVQHIESRSIAIPAQALPTEKLPGPPALKVTGIGWQKGNADRLAIVNGRAVTEGAVVEGARVEEIFPDRVRFSFNDKTFEIPLGKISGENPKPEN